MARRQRDIVDYFPHDARASEGDTLKILQNKFGNDGYAFWFKLLERLATSDGHFINCGTQIKVELLAAYTNTTVEKTISIVEILASLDAIDQEMWGKSRIIWCQHLVENVADVYRNRKRSLPEKPITTANNGISTPNNGISTPEIPQSKVKERKVKDSKERKGANPSFTEDSVESKLAFYFKDKVLKNNPKAKLPTLFTGWCQSFDQMMRLDHRTEAEIRAVIDFCQDSPFWKSNILSPAKLRDKFDTLYLQSKNGVQAGARKLPSKYTAPEDL